MAKPECHKWCQDHLGVKTAPKAANKALSSKTPKPQTIDFSDEPETVEVAVDSEVVGDKAKDVIRDQINTLYRHIGRYFRNYRDGISDFRDDMTLASEEETKVDLSIGDAI